MRSPLAPALSRMASCTSIILESKSRIVLYCTNCIVRKSDISLLGDTYLPMLDSRFYLMKGNQSERIYQWIYLVSTVISYKPQKIKYCPILHNIVLYSTNPALSSISKLRKLKANSPDGTSSSQNHPTHPTDYKISHQ